MKKIQEDNQNKVNQNNKEHKKEHLRPQTSTKQQLPKEICNNRKEEENTSRPIQNQSPEKKKIISLQSNITPKSLHTETDV